MMKTRILLTGALALVVLCAHQWAAAQPSEWLFRVVTVAGQAEVQKRSASAWKAATLRADLESGDAARTLGGRLTLKAASGQALRLAPSSRVFLLDPDATDQPPRVRMEGGSVWVAVLPGGLPREQIVVQTGLVTVTVTGSGVGITLNRDGSVLVRVYHGVAECTGPGAERRWSRTLTDEQELLVSTPSAPGEARKLNRDKIEGPWIKWNEEQDLAGGYSVKAPAR